MSDEDREIAEFPSEIHENLLRLDPHYGTLLSPLRDGRRQMASDLTSIFLETVDALCKLLASIEAGDDEGSDTVDAVSERLRAAAPGVVLDILNRPRAGSTFRVRFRLTPESTWRASDDPITRAAERPTAVEEWIRDVRSELASYAQRGW